MNRSYTCLRYRQRTTILRQKRGANFVSLGGLVENEHSRVSAVGDLGIREAFTRLRDVSPTILGQPGQLQRRQQPAGVDEILQSLFSVKQEEKFKSVKTRYSRICRTNPNGNYIGQPTVENNEDILKRMVYKEKAPLDHIWTQCLKAVESEGSDGFDASTNSEEGRKGSRDIFWDILLQICQRQAKDPLQNTLPASSDVIKIYLKHKLLRNCWTDVIWIQLGALVKHLYQNPCAPFVPGVPDLHPSVLLIEELLNIWAIFVEEEGKKQEISYALLSGANVLDVSDNNLSTATSSISKDTVRTWRGLPSVKIKRIKSTRLKTTLQRRFLFCFPGISYIQANSLGGAAVLTYRSFQRLAENNFLPKSTIEGTKPFIQWVKHITNECGFDSKEAAKSLLRQGVAVDIVVKATASVRVSPVGKKDSINATENPTSGFDLPSPSAEKPTTIRLPLRSTKVTTISRDLSKATERSDMRRAISIWQRFRSQVKNKKARDSMSEEIFIRFLHTFFTLRRPELAVEVWNFMIQSGLVPQQKHWQAMVVGSAKSKDFTSMQQIWSSMKAAGFEPDIKSWTAWIHGLIKCREWQQGLAALEELGHLWKTPKSSQLKLAPSVEPVNATISALLDINKADVVPSVIEWAKMQNIPLATSTFNTMIRPAVRQGNSEEVNRILSKMEAHSCQPDIITFTIIVNGLVSNHSSSFHNQPHETQQRIILDLLTTLERKDLRPTAQTYSTVLDGLLAPNVINVPAARAMLDHMAKRGIRPSPHIYTIILQHHFMADPPDLAAIDSLWHRTRIERAVLDPIFYDRMIEGQASAGQVERMLFFARKAAVAGCSPSWMALLAVLRELARQGEWDFARELVADVEDRKLGLLRHGEGAKVGRDWFWELVGSLREAGSLKGQERDADGEGERDGHDGW